MSFGAFKEAFDTYSAYLRRNPHTAYFIRDRAAVRAELGDVKQAFRELNHLIEISPKDPHNYYVRGKVFEKSNNLLMALADYRRAARLAPNRARYSGNATRLHQLLEG